MGKIKFTSTNCVNIQKYIVPNDLTYAVSQIGGRWKLPIMNALVEGKLRFGELRDTVSGITERMLILQLKELEKEFLITRTVYNEAPPRVDYELTGIARDLIPIWKHLAEWGAKHKMFVTNLREDL
ncbi:winged helix-turn-helix transcriptional regulator [Pedobacter sp. AW31-3R]|uniref:winged helix-turn-helix transcriptional regulator n=1 Tax=Pedobacter sp. AW31-3R TaxID=3445781 RepID=UPI003FA0E15F